MKVIKIDLPRELLSAELHTFADEHLGDHLCDLKRLQERIEYVKNTPNAYCILNGDIIDNATKSSVGDVYTQAYSPMEQLEKAVELFSPIKDKIWCISHGNHENRTYKSEGINISRLLANQLGLADRYTPTSATLFVRLGNGHSVTRGRKICYTIYHRHGSGGGSKEGSKVDRLASMASIIDTDIYIHSHTHLPVVMKLSFFRIDTANSAVAPVDKLFVNTAANLKYGGYGEYGGFKPNSIQSPVIYLSGTKKFAEAKL
jgi:hypothetical protein